MTTDREFLRALALVTVAVGAAAVLLSMLLSAALR